MSLYCATNRILTQHIMAKYEQAFVLFEKLMACVLFHIYLYFLPENYPWTPVNKAVMFWTNPAIVYKNKNSNTFYLYWPFFRDKMYSKYAACSWGFMHNNKIHFNYSVSRHRCFLGRFRLQKYWFYCVRSNRMLYIFFHCRCSVSLSCKNNYIFMSLVCLRSQGW